MGKERWKKVLTVLALNKILMYTCMYVCMHACMYVYVYIYAYMYVYHVRTCVCRFELSELKAS